MTRTAAPAPLDTLFSAETPEGIALALRPAGLVARSYAFALDAAIRLMIVFAAATLLFSLQRFGIGIFLVLLFAIEWLYPVLFELLPGAATPGKRVVGLKVVMDSGLPVTPAAALVRNLLRSADFLPLLYGFGGLLMLLRPDFKRLGDLAAGTLVVHTAPAALHGPLGTAPPLAPPRPLSTREQAAVLAWAGRAARLTPARLGELALLAGPLVASAPAVVTGAPRSPGDDPQLAAASPERLASEAAARLLGIAQWLAGRR